TPTPCPSSPFVSRILVLSLSRTSVASPTDRLLPQVSRYGRTGGSAKTGATARFLGPPASSFTSIEPATRNSADCRGCSDLIVIPPWFLLSPIGTTIGRESRKKPLGISP